MLLVRLKDNSVKQKERFHRCAVFRRPPIQVPLIAAIITGSVDVTKATAIGLSNASVIKYRDPLLPRLLLQPLWVGEMNAPICQPYISQFMLQSVQRHRNTSFCQPRIISCCSLCKCTTTCPFCYYLPSPMFSGFVFLAPLRIILHARPSLLASCAPFASHLIRTPHPS
jgi:hypothetical protein